VKLARIYTGEDNCSHFEDLDIPMHSTGPAREGSDPLPLIGASLGASEPLTLDFHPAPMRQLVTLLGGALELECSDGAKRLFATGDMFLADDTSGAGHISRAVSGQVRLLLLYLSEDFDPLAWGASSPTPS
jgi:hypothetical protein